MIAKIAVSAANYAIDKPYSYFVPPELSLVPGIRVLVPFGRGNRRAEGVVLSVEDGTQGSLKTVEAKLDDTPVLSDYMLRMAAFLRERYFCTFYDAIRAMLPAGLWFQYKESYSLTEDTSWEGKPLRQKTAEKILLLLRDAGGGTDRSVLEAALGEEELDKAIQYLLKKGWILCHQDYARKAGDKLESVATLAVSGEEALSFAANRPKSAVMQKNVMELLCSIGSASVKEICYFTGAKPATVKRLSEMGYLTLSDRQVLRCRQIVPETLTGPLVLNAEQQAAVNGLCAQMQQAEPGGALLHGVTGSGKTAVYIKLIESCLSQGKQAMLLVPEIALTPQLLGKMAAYFGDAVAVLHSSLPAGERYDQWKRIRQGEAKVIVGTRSAVFAPCADLGMIILDEEQEHSYKSENSPRYSAKEVALWRGAKEKALVLFGSATPSVETMYQAKTGKLKLYTLTARYNGRALPQVELVDMHQQLQMGNDLSLSYDLQDAIADTRAAGKQAILFLNRRGNSRALVCVDCRETPECPGAMSGLLTIVPMSG